MDEIELTTEQMTYGGSALARHGGRVVFVPYALPGERVRVRLTRRRKRWAEAELLAVLTPSPDRVEPPCPHFGPHRCGGCHWQHARYEAQLAYKTAIVREQFERIGKLDDPPVRPCLGMDDPWHYRNHVQLRAAPDGLGFVRADNRGVYPIDRCLIMNAAVYGMFEAVAGRPLALERLVLRGSARTGERLAVVEGGDAAALADALPADACLVERDARGRERAVRGEPFYTEVAGERRWHLPAGGFFQVNTQQAETLLATVRALAGPLRGDETLLDAYAGVGFFGLSLADEVARVFLVESHPAAVAAAREHAAGVAHATIIEGVVEAVLARWEHVGPPPDLALLDPPRAGCKPSVLDALGKMQLPTIIYVSCDPSTQARDVRHLLDAGYALDVIQPVDLFPQTYHVESVARLRGAPRH